MKKSIIYTESANYKIESILEEFKLKIEEDITERKDYPGEEIIEITASDIEKTYSRVRLLRAYSKVSQFSKMTKLVIPIYFALGIVVMIYGLFYEDIQEIIKNSPERLMIILGGFIISLTTGTFYLLQKQRDSERKKELNRKNDVDDRIKYE